MFDSLAYRNDAAIVMRRLIRSLPTASGVLGIATCDKGALTGTVNLVGTTGRPLDAGECDALLRSRPRHPGLAPHPKLPADSRLWAALQRASGGTWGGCVYDVDRIVEALDAGIAAQRARGEDATEN